MVWLVSPTMGVPRKFISNNIGYPWKADNSKSIKELGIKYRPVQETINEFFEQMIEHGAFKKK